MHEGGLRDDHTRRVIALYDEIAADYDRDILRFYPFTADRLVARLPPGAGDKLLDVCAGTGAVSLAAMQAVGPAGRISAVDLSGRMLDQLQAKVAKFGITNIDLHVMDAQALEFRRDYFHHVVCAYGLDLVADPQRALHSWHRVLRPGGSVLVAVPGPQAFQPMLGRLREQLAAAGTGGGPFGCARQYEPDGLRQMLEWAGFADVTAGVEPLGYFLRNAEEWWDIVWRSPLRCLLPGEAPALVEPWRREHLAGIADLVVEGSGLWLNAEVVIASARKPGKLLHGHRPVCQAR